jgi:hypothetical protein
MQERWNQVYIVLQRVEYHYELKRRTDGYIIKYWFKER